MSNSYEKILNVFLSLRDTHLQFKFYSAQDIKKLIEAKMKSKTLKEPKALQPLYELEIMIRELREGLEIEKSQMQV